MKKLLIGLLVLGSTSSFASEYIFMQFGMSNNELTTVFSSCSSDAKQFKKWNKLVNKKNLFEGAVASDSMIFNSSDECSNFLYDLIEKQNIQVVDGISLKQKIKKNHLVQKGVITYKTIGNIKY